MANSFSRAAGRQACHELLDRDLGLTALVAANDLLALGCYDALAERGLSCPDDISVTGYNDAPFVDMVMPPLTTVRIRQREMGIEAARLLLARMTNPQAAADRYSAAADTGGAPVDGGTETIVATVGVRASYHSSTIARRDSEANWRRHMTMTVATVVAINT